MKIFTFYKFFFFTSHNFSHINCRLDFIIFGWSSEYNSKISKTILHLLSTKFKKQKSYVFSSQVHLRNLSSKILLSPQSCSCELVSKQTGLQTFFCVEFRMLNAKSKILFYNIIFYIFSQFKKQFIDFSS